MNEPGVVAVYCTHFPQLLVIMGNKETPEVRIEVQKNQKEIWPLFCAIFFHSSLSHNYGVATVSRIDEILVLFCKRAL